MMMNNQPEEKNSMLNVLSIRDFRLLFAGTSTSLLGDQFALIATPWLVLQLTGDPLALGIVPMLVKEKDLQAGNSIVMGSGQLVGFVGPVVAGILIGSFSESLFGVGLAFGIDSITFAISAVMLWLMRRGGKLPSSVEASDK